MSLWKYKYFVDVVDSKSFTKAGKKNFVSQTAVSQQISSLEKSIGGKLIERGNGEIVPTGLGQIVYNKAKEILRINEEMFREIQDYKDKSVMEIGVDCSINRLFWKKIERMLDSYYADSGDRFRFNKVDVRAGSRMLEDNYLDIFIGYDLSETKKEELEEAILCKNKVGIFLGSRTSLKHKEKLSLEDLEGYTRYETKAYSCSMQSVHPDATFQKMHGKLKCEDNVDTMKLKVEFNDGYAFADSQYFSYEDGELRTLSDFDKYCVMKFYYKRDGNKKKKEEIFTHLQSVI